MGSKSSKIGKNCIHCKDSDDKCFFCKKQNSKQEQSSSDDDNGGFSNKGSLVNKHRIRGVGSKINDDFIARD